MKYLALLFFLLVSNSALATPALPLSLSVEGDLDSGLREQLPDLVRSALGFVKVFPPRGYANHFFEWTAGRQILNGKEFGLVLTTSRNPHIAPIISKSDPGQDAFTMAPVNPQKKTMSIVVVLLADRLFFDRAGVERTDGYARLVLALAHEIYGNVQTYLEIDLNQAKAQTRENRVTWERKAFQASLNFLGSLRDHPTFLKLPDHLREGLMGLLPKEIAAYRSWVRSHGGAELDSACEEMLGRADRGPQQNVPES